MADALVVIPLAVAVALGAAVAAYVDGNRRSEERDLGRALAAGFVEKQAHVRVQLQVQPQAQVRAQVQADAQGGTPTDARESARPGTATFDAVVNYAEGPDNGPALLLIHGQAMEWEDYARSLPGLAASHHVFAIDCFGHGESSHNPALYTCEAQGRALVAFADQVIGGPYLVSGHSSGGIVAAWLAANDAARVTGCVLEDPPFFRVAPEEVRAGKGAFVWHDAYRVMHDFLQQSDVKDPAVYYARHGYLFSLFGGLQPKIAAWAEAERAANPDAHLTFALVPHSWTRGTYFYDDFDPRFTEAFYDGSWMAGVDQEALLSMIPCPTVYLKAKTRYGKDGVLYAANSDEDAARVAGMLRDGVKLEVSSGHDIHYERADLFVRTFAQLG